MNINFTRKEFSLLLEMIYLADWIMHAHSLKDQDRHLEHLALKRRIEALSRAQGLEETSGPAHDKYMQEKFIRFYDEKVVWEERFNGK